MKCTLLRPMYSLRLLSGDKKLNMNSKSANKFIWLYFSKSIAFCYGSSDLFENQSTGLITIMIQNVCFDTLIFSSEFGFLKSGFFFVPWRISHCRTSIGSIWISSVLIICYQETCCNTFHATLKMGIFYILELLYCADGSVVEMILDVRVSFKFE